jgi:hypothetical protein
VNELGLDRPGIDGPGLHGPGLHGPGLYGPGLDRLGLDRPGLDRPGIDGRGPDGLGPAGDEVRISARRVLAFGILSLAVAAAYLIVIGVVTAVIPNPVFERMTPVTPSNVVFWILPAVLFGPLAASYLVPVTPATCATGERTLAGGVLSFLAVGCPLCNKVVVLALGASGALAYFEPIQPLLGVASVALLAYGLWLRLDRPLARR